jgi:vancomycin resistance protein YoaR
MRVLAARLLWLVAGLWCCCALLLVVDGAPTAAFARGARKPPRHEKDRLAVSIPLTDGVRTVVRTRREFGFRLASRPGHPVAFAVDRKALQYALRRIAPAFRQPGVNARPYVYHGHLQIDPGADARALNVATTAERLAAAVARKPALVRFRATLSKKPPVLTAGRLKGITGVLGSYATRASPNPKRRKNIRLAVQSIDGRLLSPGETFSLNRTIGQRTQARGYRTAPVFVDAAKVPGIGGGVSQVTGTLFNAAALAGLEIVEVNPHSRPVSYIPVGRDATLVYGTEDLRFRNNTGHPVYLSYQFTGRELRATLFGHAVRGQRVSLRPRVHSLGPGKIDAALYRVIKRQGKVVAKERLFRHAYRWNPRSRGV